MITRRAGKYSLPLGPNWLGNALDGRGVRQQEIADNRWGLTMAGGYRCLSLALGMALSLLASNAPATQNNFPFDGELLLDANPMPGSKRVPNMDITAKGAIVLEMWCNRVEGQLVVAADTVTVMTGQATDRQCTPARARADADLLAALMEVTNWRRQGNMVLFIGPRTLRFRVPTN
jgi:heat shock protein HslJ